MGVVVNSGGKEIPISSYYMKRRHEQAEICSIFEILTHKSSKDLSTENRSIMHYSRYLLQEFGHFMDDSYTFSMDVKRGIVSPSFDEEILSFASFDMVDPKGLLDPTGKVIDKDISKLVEIYQSGGEVLYTPGEFNKGTIKQLLIKPHTRFKIILSKYIVSVSMILFGVLSLIIMELIVGGILFGYSSLSVPVVVYNFNNSAVQTYNIFYYLIILFIHKLPIFLLLTTLVFLMGVLTTSSAISIVIGIMGYTISPLINMMASYYNVHILRYFPTLNWDLTQYMFGMIPQNKNINFGLSIMMDIGYFLFMIIPIFIVFNKKNIKNI